MALTNGSYLDKCTHSNFLKGSCFHLSTYGCNEQNDEHHRILSRKVSDVRKRSNVFTFTKFCYPQSSLRSTVKFILISSRSSNKPIPIFSSHLFKMDCRFSEVRKTFYVDWMTKAIGMHLA